MDMPVAHETVTTPSRDAEAWNPYGPAPAGLTVENFRKTGIDEVRVSARAVVTWRVAALATAVVTLLMTAALVAGGHWTLVAIALSLIVVGMAASKLVAAPAWTLSILPGELALNSGGRSFATMRSERIRFSEIEGINITTMRANGSKALVVSTTRATRSFGECLPDATLLWLKNYLIMEFAGLTWKPISTLQAKPTAPPADTSPNPVMLKPDLAMRLIALFLGQAPAAFDQLRRAVAAGDATEIRRHAHWLKSASANVGAHHLSELCQLMEMYAIDNDLGPCRMLCREIDKKLPGVESWLKDLRVNASEKLVDPQGHRRSPSPAAAPATMADQVDKACEDILRRARILVADDSALSREIAHEYLCDLVAVVEFADDGKVAVDKWREGSFDLIFMDCEMILMNGFDAAREIRREEAAKGAHRIPIVALTGHILQDTRNQCFAAGMDDYIGKPYHPENLRETVKKWLSQQVGNRAA